MKDDIRVIVSCGGKFHAFHLAEQLDKRGYLHRLITSYYSQKDKWFPRFRKDGEKIDPQKVITNIFPEIISRVFNLNYYALEFFDGWAREQIDKCDLFIGWSGYSLHSLRRTKSYGAMTVIERGSSHILYQKKILEEEYEKYGVKIKPVDDRIVQKELYEYSESDYISVPSSYVKQTFIDNGTDPQKLICVPYGVNLTNFKPVPKTDNVFRVIFAGGLSLRKGIHYLLEAFSELRLKNAELLLMGSISPEITSFLEKYKNCYKYIGKVPHAELYKYFSSGSVFVLPSIEEGMAMVILQAMACKLPVICTINTGGADLVRDNKEGFVIPIRDINALKEKILYLYEHEKECKSMSENALSRAKDFTWDIYGERIINVYKESLKQFKNDKNMTSSAQVRDHYKNYWNEKGGFSPSHSFSESLYKLHFNEFISKDDSVLDVGCGKAENYQLRVKSESASLVCLDVSPTAVEIAKRNGFDARVHDFSERFDFPDNSFNKAICLEVLEHLFDPLFCIREIYRVLKPDGKIIASVPNSGYFRWRAGMLFRLDLPFSVSDFSNPWRSDHIRFFDLKSFTELLICAGFEIENVRSNEDTSIFDVLSILGAPGRFLSSLLNKKMPSLLKLSFLGNIFPRLFAPHLIVVAKKQD